MSLFSQLTDKPTDPIIKVFEEFLANPNPNKVNLSIGLYFDDQGRIFYPKSVRLANLELANEKPYKGYLPITGDPEFCALAVNLTFGENNPVVKAGRIASAQTIAATGGLRVTADFLYRTVGSRKCFVTDPTWSNHIDIFKTAGYKVDSIAHLDSQTLEVNIEKTLADLESKVGEKDVVLLHPICHNPTGADYTKEQWQAIYEVIKRKNAILVLDQAYLGYGEGLEQDRLAVELASQVLDQFVHIFSASKTFGIYSERVGSVNILCKDAQQAQIVKSQLAITIRSSYSTPYGHGARIVKKILSNPELRKIWMEELEHARQRIISNRKVLVDALAKYDIDWSYILKQHGFFSYLKVTKEQALELRSKYAIYILESGRVNFAGINQSNIDYICDSLVKVLKGE